MIAGLYDCFRHWHENGTVWLYSDPHFNDPDQRLMCSHWPEDDEQVKLINSKVGKSDTLICLGDVGDTEFVKKIRAKYKILICGNHDAGATLYKHKKISDKFDYDLYTKDDVVTLLREKYPNYKYSVEEGYDVSHAPFHFWVGTADNQLFDEVYTGPLMIGEKLILSHEPISNITWAYNIHGHAHDGCTEDEYHFNCCSNIIKFTPINFNIWMKQGRLAKIDSIHRATIDKATERKTRRNRNA